MGPRISAELHRQKGWVIAMAGEAKQKGEAKPKGEAKEGKEKKEKKAKAPAETPAAAAEAPKAPPPPRTPGDPRLKVVKQLRSKLLPRGPLRDRYKVLMERWDSADDHGGVTVQELKGLLDERKAAR